MARQFTGSQYGTLAADTINAGSAYTLLAWVKKSTLDSTDQVVFGACRSTSFERSAAINYRGSQTGKRFGGYGYTGSPSYATGPVDSVSDTWIPVVITRVAGSGTQATTVDVLVSGVRYTNAAGATAVIPSGTHDRVIVGCTFASGSPVQQFIGLIGAVAKWNVILSSANIDALLAGADPSTVDNANLYDSWVFDADTGSTSTGSKGNVLTWTGSPAHVADSPFATGPSITAVTDPVEDTIVADMDNPVPVTSIEISSGIRTEVQSNWTSEALAPDDTRFTINPVDRATLPFLGTATLRFLDDLDELIVDTSINLTAWSGWKATLLDGLTGADIDHPESINQFRTSGTPTVDDQYMWQEITATNVQISNNDRVTFDAPGSFQLYYWDGTNETMSGPHVFEVDETGIVLVRRLRIFHNGKVLDIINSMSGL